MRDFKKHPSFLRKCLAALRNRRFQVLVLTPAYLYLAYHGLVDLQQAVQQAREAARRQQLIGPRGDPVNDSKTLLTMRAMFPIVPLRDRLHYEKMPDLSDEVGDTRTLSPESEQLLTRFEEKFKTNTRRRMLSALHDASYEEFVARAGFGFRRMWPPLEWGIVRIPEPAIVPLPRQLSPEKSNPNEVSQFDHELATIYAAPQNEWPTPFWNLHGNRYFDFVNPTRLGAMALVELLPRPQTSRSEHTNVSANQCVDSEPTQREPLTVGFMPHAMTHDNDLSFLPQIGEWKILRLELVSLLKYHEPRVYLSTHLPNMEELKTAKTRPLNTFEQHALQQLRNGEEVVVDSNANHIQMVGAVRAATQCLDCHTVRRGDLLGAFSYSLERLSPNDSDSRISMTHPRRSFP